MTRRAFAAGAPACAALLAGRAARGQSRPGAAATPGGAFSAYLYRVGSSGNLIWQRHDAAAQGDGPDVAGSWTGTQAVGTGWTGARMFGGGGATIYLVDGSGNLKWYKHDGYKTGATLGTEGAWAPQSQTQVGNGWGGLQQVFSVGYGIIYTVTQAGVVNWYQHKGYEVGTPAAVPDAWVTREAVMTGWGGLLHAFSGGDGVIYTITRDGSLFWHRHNQFRTGLGGPDAWSGPAHVSSGWGAAAHVVSPGHGVIYAVAADGTLEWFRHLGYLTGAADDWLGPRDAGRGWDGLQHVFALQPPAG